MWIQKSAATNQCDNKYTATWTEQFTLELWGINSGRAAFKLYRTKSTAYIVKKYSRNTTKGELDDSLLGFYAVLIDLLGFVPTVHTNDERSLQERNCSMVLTSWPELSISTGLVSLNQHSFQIIL